METTTPVCQCKVALPEVHVKWYKRVPLGLAAANLVTSDREMGSDSPTASSHNMSLGFPVTVFYCAAMFFFFVFFACWYPWWILRSSSQSDSKSFLLYNCYSHLWCEQAGSWVATMISTNKPYSTATCNVLLSQQRSWTRSILIPHYILWDMEKSCLGDHLAPGMCKWLRHMGGLNERTRVQIQYRRVKWVGLAYFPRLGREVRKSGAGSKWIRCFSSLRATSWGALDT